MSTPVAPLDRARPDLPGARSADAPPAVPPPAASPPVDALPAHPARPGPARPGPARPGPSRPGPSRPGPRSPGPWGGLLRALAVLLPALALLLWLFRPEAIAAVTVWRQSTAYNHCILVLPIALWLGWDRRRSLAWQQPRPEALLLLLALPAGLAWLAAQRLGIMEGRQLAALAAFEVLCLAVLGRALFRRLSGPLLYLVFLVPFGAFVTPLLQRFTAGFIVAGLSVLGIPHSADGTVIAIPEGVFLVAEACAGLRFLIACVAFGVLYALMMFRSPGRRLGFVALCVVTPILANGLRALGIVVLGHWLGSAEAAAADHLIYGWVFFSMVIAVLVLVGLPFRQDLLAPPAAPMPSARRPSPGMLAAVTLAGLLLAAAGPGAAALLRGAPGQVALAAGWSPAGCSRDGSLDGVARFACGDAVLLLQRFPAGEDPGRLPALQRRLTGQDGAEDVQVAALLPQGGPWRLVRVMGPDATAATAVWVGGEPARAGLSSRLHQAWAGLSSDGAPAILAILHADGPAAAALLRQAVATNPALTTQLARLSVAGDAR